MKKLEGLALAIVALSFLASIFAYSHLPDRMATHWSASGDPNGYSSKAFGLFLMPAISLLLLGLLAFFVRADPLLAGTRKFKSYPEWIFIIMVGFFTYLHLLIILFNSGLNFDFTYAMVPGFSALFILLGWLIKEAPRNYTVGIRTPWTLADDEVWQKTHLLGGKLFQLAGLIGLAGLLFPKVAFFFMLVPVVLSAIFLVLYSYLVYRSKNQTQPHVMPKKKGKQARPAKRNK